MVSEDGPMKVRLGEMIRVLISRGQSLIMLIETAKWHTDIG